MLKIMQQQKHILFPINNNPRSQRWVSVLATKEAFKKYGHKLLAFDAKGRGFNAGVYLYTIFRCIHAYVLSTHGEKSTTGLFLPNALSIPNFRLTNTLLKQAKIYEG